MRSRTLLALVALGVLGACSEDIRTPTSPVSMTRANGVTRTHLAGGVHGTPNSVKYSNRGIHPATGRSGSASLEARALLDKDGNTVVEASTGSLENGTSLGNIAKVQLKSPSTQNFNNLSNTGYWSTNLAGVVRGQAIQVQANVRGIDPKRTDVVTVLTPAVRRPDITVRSVTAPATAPPNTGVMISATVSELNGDVGARADCVLAIDGTNVDHADGIWVDALGTVSCLFNHTFAAAGSYNVTVSAANVVPGDWDLSNNSASTTVTIASPGTISYGSLSAAEYHYSYDYNSGYFYPTNSQEYLSHYDENYSYVSGYGYDYRSIPAPMQRIDYQISVDGSNVLTGSTANTNNYTYDDGSSYRYTCSEMYEDSTWGYVCSYDYYGNGGYTYYQVQVLRGTTTYLGQTRYCDSFGCNTYVTSSGTTTYGSPTPLGFVQGSRVRLLASFIDVNGDSHTFDATTDPLARYDMGPWNDYSYCYTFDITNTYCYGQHYPDGGYYTVGYASFYNP